MKINNLNQLKNTLKVGDVLTLIDHSWEGVKTPHKALNIPRAISIKQTQSIKFDDGSWLYLGCGGEKARDFTFTEAGFTYDNGHVLLSYIYN